MLYLSPMVCALPTEMNFISLNLYLAFDITHVLSVNDNLAIVVRGVLQVSQYDLLYIIIIKQPIKPPIHAAFSLVGCSKCS